MVSWRLSVVSGQWVGSQLAMPIDYRFLHSVFRLPTSFLWCDESRFGVGEVADDGIFLKERGADLYLFFVE